MLRWLSKFEIALILVAPFVYWQMPHEISSDGYLRLETTRYLARGEVIDQPVPMFMSVAALPLYHFGDIVAQFNVFVFFGALAVIAALLWTRVPADVLRRFVLLLIVASMFAHHTQLFFGELLTAMLVATGIALLIAGLPLFGYVALICGVINQPATLPGMVLMLVATDRSLRGVVRAAIPATICVALIMFEFYLRRGDPFSSGYEGDHGQKSILPYSGLPGFSNPFVFGVLSILFSFGKGIGIYAPGLWLTFKRTVSATPDALRLFQRHALWFLAGIVIVYAKWWAWPGGWFWGPRFFLFASIPAAMALSMHLCDRAAAPTIKALTVALLAWSVWVGIDGAVYGQLDMSICNTEPNIEPLCWYSPEYSALFRPFIVDKTLTNKERIVFGYFALSGVVLAIPFARDLASDAIRRARRLPGRQTPR